MFLIELCSEIPQYKGWQYILDLQLFHPFEGLEVDSEHSVSLRYWLIPMVLASTSNCVGERRAPLLTPLSSFHDSREKSDKKKIY